jgi:hypothetical protein
MQFQIQNFGKPTIYPSFVNTSFNSQPDTTLNISSNANDVQDIPVELGNTSQVLPIITPLNTLPTPTLLNMNDNQALNIQAGTPNLTLLPMQDYQQQVLYPPLLVRSHVMNEHSFFYTPYNDFQMYHIICKEISFNFESVSQLISNTDNNMMNNYDQSGNIFVFYYEQPEIKKIYQVTCEMVSHTFLFQYLNKIIYKRSIR